MIPIQDLLHRIRWDPEFGRDEFVIGYYDRIEHEIILVPFREIRFPKDGPGIFELIDQEEKAQSALNRSLEKQAIDLEQLMELLKKDERWLTEQKTGMTALERTLHESEALFKVKADDCRKLQSNPVDIPEKDANKLSAELQQRRQALHTQKEEQVILLREDDKKIEAGRLLKAELDEQQHRWEQWESLNELIGSKNGAKFRTFAQSLTLEALLAHSNQHLEEFAKRYALQRVPGSDLELQIIDRDMAMTCAAYTACPAAKAFWCLWRWPWG